MSKAMSHAQSELRSPQYSFARFWRCALQVNPWRYQASYRGQDHGLDEDAYNQALLSKCQEVKIQVVGIADHGSVDGIDKLRGVLQAGGIVVFPGFEIASTEKIHMVCLFPEDTAKDQLNRYLGKLDLTNVGDGVGPSRLGCLDLAKIIVDEMHGFWYAAHVTGCNGLLRLNKDGGGLCHIWKDAQYVRVAQIPGPVEGLSDNCREIVENRNPDYRRARPITVIHAKDVARPEDLKAPAASSWIKMTRPSFEAFKIAFLDPESRVRLAMSDHPHSVIESMRIHGGYLDAVEARFSQHLNTLIGGRGTGKSTLIECLRYVLELAPKGKQALRLHQDIVKENLGNEAGSVELSVRSSAQHGARFTITRRYGEPAIVRDESGEVSRQSPCDLLPGIEVYGQNEIFELAQDSPRRARLLDRFLPADHAAIDHHETLRKRLAENAQKLMGARAELDELAEKVARLPKLGEQLEGFQALGIEAKLAKTPLYARERQLVERVEQEIGYLEKALQGLGEGLPDLTFLGDKALEGLPDQGVLAEMRGDLGRLRDEVAGHLKGLEEAIKTGRSALVPRKAAWQAAIKAGEQELENVGLPDLAGKTGREIGAAYRQLSQEIESTKPLEAKKEALVQLVASLEQDRRTSLPSSRIAGRHARASWSPPWSH